MKEHIVNVVSLVILILVFIVTIVFNDQFDTGVLQQIIGACIIIIGLILWVAGKITLGKYFTTSFIPKGLITKGIYSKVRHPMYSGGSLIYLGIGLLFKSIIGLVLTVALIIPLLIYCALEEEKMLIRKYGKRYIEYKKKTII